MSLTFLKCVELFRKARNGRRKIGNNTYLKQHDDYTFAVVLHSTPIVLIHKDDTYTLDTGGWRTVTTKARMNEFSPARISQANNIWYINGTAVYRDGIKVDSSGRPLGKTDDADAVLKKKRALDKKVLAYVRAYAADAVANGGLRAPSGGDCWACYFTGDDKSRANHDNPMGFDHLLQHRKDSYYVPSLLWKAIRARGYASPEVIWHFIDSDVKAGSGKKIVEELSRYFRKLKPELLNLHS